MSRAACCPASRRRSRARRFRSARLVQVTDAEGAYRFVDLPAGTYKLKFELTGFSTLIREDLRLTIGFTARVDESMKVGSMEESVTVSGQSPSRRHHEHQRERGVHQRDSRGRAARPRPSERSRDGAGRDPGTRSTSAAARWRSGRIRRATAWKRSPSSSTKA